MLTLTAPELRELTGVKTPDAQRLWATWDDKRRGWCVFLDRDSLSATLVAGPFATREEAEKVLGPALPTAVAPPPRPPAPPKWNPLAGIPFTQLKPLPPSPSDPSKPRRPRKARPYTRVRPGPVDIE